MKRRKELLHIHRSLLERAKYPGDENVLKAVADVSDPEGWALPSDIGNRLWASRPAAVRWCRRLSLEGKLKEGLVEGYTGKRGMRRSRSIAFRLP